MWHSGEGGSVSCGVVGGRLCIVWHSGEGGYRSCGIVGIGVNCHSGMGGYV